MNGIGFLKVVWGTRRGWIDLPSKVNGYWVPWHHRWPADSEVLTERIRSCVEDGEDLYFSPAMFSRRGRDIERALPMSWLWADLDEVEPGEVAKQGLLPTVVWQSSPGRYQALWRLTRSLRPEVQARLNRRLSYVIGADRSGWDTTQVLRVVGTRNFKYEGGPSVDLVLTNERRYDPKKLWKDLKRLSPDYTEGVAAASSVVREAGPRPLPSLPVRAQRLLSVGEADVVVGERSTRRWELECMLLEAGCTEDQVLELVAPTPWNSWSGSSATRQLTREIRKARAKVLSANGGGNGAVKTTESQPDKSTTDDEPTESATPRPDTGLPFVRYSSFMAMNMEAPRWLIEEIWTSQSHGILGGEPKTSKSTLALAMGLSIASGKPFLGKYPVRTTGAVLMVQEENAPWVMQDRMRKIASFYGLIHKSDVTLSAADEAEIVDKRVQLQFPDDVPFRLLNNYGFSLTNEEHRDQLEAIIDRDRPVMVILDPLYLMVGATNVDRAEQIQPFMKWLMYLRYTYGCAVVLIHHWRKAKEFDAGVRGGQRLMGSGLLHGWVESAMYCERIEAEDETVLGVRLEREFRNVGPQPNLEVRMKMGEPGSLAFDAEVIGWTIEGQLLKVVGAAGGAMTASAAAEAVGCDKRTALSRARGSESLVVEGGKRGRGYSWTIRLATEEDKDD